MQPLLLKFFVLPFYKKNAGFFLFFFFIFFGAVQGGSLVYYHLSLIHSMLGHASTLAVVLACWSAYHIKCFLFILQSIRESSGAFHGQIQARRPAVQLVYFLQAHTTLYLPVLLYSIVVMVIGLKEGARGPVLVIGLFQAGGLVVAAVFYRLFYRLQPFTHRLLHGHRRRTRARSPALYVLYLWLGKKSGRLLVLKLVSFIFLFIALVLNRDGFSNDSFILLFLIVSLSQSVIGLETARYLEANAGFVRNLPIPLAAKAVFIIFGYALLLVPELCYLLSNTPVIAPYYCLVYYLVLVSTLWFLTGLFYSQDMDNKGFIKVAFMQSFLSVIALHAEAFLAWSIILLVIGTVLFVTGYYRFEQTES